MPIYGEFRCIRSQCFFLAAVSFLLAFSCSTLASSQENTPELQPFERISAQADQARDSHDLDKALVLYRQALGFRPGWAEGWWSLGTILYDRDNYPEAARAFQRLVALRPDHGSARVMLGLCQFELGQDESALRNIQKGRQLGV